MKAYRQLLVHLDAGTRTVPRLRAARFIGKEQGAAVTACYAVTSSYLDAAYGGELAPQIVAALAELDEERHDRARKAFDVEMRAPGPVATWSEASGMGTVAEFTRQALYADLLVLGQEDPSNPGGAPAGFNQAVILDSGRPALVLPYTGWDGTFGKTAVIAWKETPQAARAVSAAMPLLQRAASVQVLHWAKEPESAVTGHRLDLKEYLRLHDIVPEWHEAGDEPEAVGDLVLSRAFDLDADLLVMGCYGHSRAREFVLGGMSRTIFRSMTLPVLMSH
jgi:nucleotide-binding universal stress UspA family protein